MSDGTSVRDSLQATMTELGGEATPEAAIAAAPVAEAAAPVEAADPAPDPEQAAAGRERGPDGKFLPKPAEVSAEAPPATEKTETAPLADKEAPQEPIRVPPSLSAAVKAQWSELPPEVQKDIQRLEDTVQTAKAEWGRKGERLNRYDEIMAPRAEKFALQGIDEFTAIKTLLAAQDFLERDPLAGIQHLARSYGVNLQSAGQQPNGQQPGAEVRQNPTVDPAIQAALQPLLQQVQTLQTEIQSSKQSSEAARLSEAQADLAAFVAKPENMYFDNVKSDVVRRLESGAAKTLAEAYEQATWASPEIRPLLLKQQSADITRKATDDAARKKAEQSRQAAGSVTGAPAGGAQAQRPSSMGNVRADLMAAFQEHGATV